MPILHNANLLSTDNQVLLALAAQRDSLHSGLRGSQVDPGDCIPLPIPHFTGSADAHHRLASRKRNHPLRTYGEDLLPLSRGDQIAAGEQPK
jgi:hypothetical protein